MKRSFGCLPLSLLLLADDCCSPSLDTRKSYPAIVTHVPNIDHKISKNPFKPQQNGVKNKNCCCPLIIALHPWTQESPSNCYSNAKYQPQDFSESFSPNTFRPQRSGVKTKNEPKSYLCAGFRIQEWGFPTFLLFQGESICMDRRRTITRPVH